MWFDRWQDGTVKRVWLGARAKKVMQSKEETPMPQWHGASLAHHFPVLCFEIDSSIISNDIPKSDSDVEKAVDMS